MNDNLGVILSIVGTFGTIALSINAFFLKGIYSDLNAVKLKMVEFFGTNQINTKRIDDLENLVHKLEEKCHKNSNAIQEIKYAIRK